MTDGHSLHLKAAKTKPSFPSFGRRWENLEEKEGEREGGGSTPRLKWLGKARHTPPAEHGLEQQDGPRPSELGESSLDGGHVEHIKWVGGCRLCCRLKSSVTQQQH